MIQTLAVMRIAPFFALVLGSYFFIFSGPASAEGLPEVEEPYPAAIEDETVNSLIAGLKMLDPDVILKDFMDGKSTTRVIVNLQKPARANVLLDLKNMAVREQLREAVSQTQDRLIDDLNPLEVRVTNRFNYIFAFSAEVTIEGLQKLAGDPDVLSIEKEGIASPGVNLEQAGNSLLSGATVYVDPSGSCGGRMSCYTTIQAAINAAP